MFSTFHSFIQNHSTKRGGRFTVAPIDVADLEAHQDGHQEGGVGQVQQQHDLGPDHDEGVPGGGQG